MSVDKARRGRPKGSGLDDHVSLDEIRRRLERDPGLRPTTAIKSLGISDPATIRRLRDKLRKACAEPEGNKAIVHADVPAISGSVCSDSSAATRVLPSTGRHCPSETSEAGRDSYDGCAGALPKPAHDDGIEWLWRWCGLSLRAISTTVEGQMAALEALLRVPQVASMMRQQLLLNQHILSVCASSPDARKTLH